MRFSNALLKRISLFVTACYWAAILTATHLPPDKIPPLGSSDKSIHTMAYLGLALLLHWALYLRNVSVVKACIAVAIIGMVYGALDELTQPYFRRSCDVRDWYADVSGLAIATVVAVTIRVLLRSRGALRHGNIDGLR